MAWKSFALMTRKTKRNETKLDYYLHAATPSKKTITVEINESLTLIYLAY
jgi:hypothetical protein